MDALDERVLRDDEPARELGRVVLDADDQPAPLELAQEAELAGLREPHRPPLGRHASPRRARMTATPDAPARMHSAAFVASMPPIATTGTETARQTSRSPSSPIGSPASGFEGVGQIGPAPT